METRIPASERTNQKLNELLSQGVADGDARRSSRAWTAVAVSSKSTSRAWAEVTYSELMLGRLRDPVLRRIHPRLGV